MKIYAAQLETFFRTQHKFRQKGGLCVALVVSRHARDLGIPLNPNELITDGGGQVLGLGKAQVQSILADHDITKVLAEEGGRTSRGSIGAMRDYVALLNGFGKMSASEAKLVEQWWVSKVASYFSTQGPKFRFDSGKSVQANIETLLAEAEELESSGANYLGALLQHLVGAKLDLVLGVGKTGHHGYTVADAVSGRKGDFQIDIVVLHVTTQPGEALARKCEENLAAGLRPLVVTTQEGVGSFRFTLKQRSLSDRVDVLDVVQFLTANLYERSLFVAQDCSGTFLNLLRRYNELVAAHETDPGLKIRLPD